MKYRWILITAVLFFSLSAFVLLAQEDEALRFSRLVYSNDFEGEVGSEWSNTKTEKTPSGRKFLGRFSNGTVSLTLTDLPTHKEVTVSFELFIIQSWDGNSTRHGPDVWDLSIDGGPTLLHTTFRRPVAFENNTFGYLWKVEKNTLGYLWGKSPSDEVYRLSFTFSHSASSLVLNSSGNGLQGVSDESWGIDNVEVNIFSIEITPQKILPRTIGDSFSIDLEAVVLAPLHGFTFDFTFNPAVLQAVSVEPGSFFSNNGADPITWETPQIDNATGRITGISCLREGEDGVSGDGVLAQITFEAIKVGESALQIENASFSDPDGNPIEFGTRDGSVTVFDTHGRITGRIIDFEGKPVRGIEVFALKEDTRVGINGETDWDGNYVIENLTEAGEVTVRARKAGLLPGIGTVSVQIGETTANVDFVLAQPSGLNSVVDESGFIRDWLLLGAIPWENDANRLITDQFAVTNPDEPFQPQEGKTKSLQPRVGEYGKGAAKEKRWTLHADSDKDIDLANLYGKIKGVVYAFTLVKSLEAREVTLQLGSGDGLIVWLNDELVHLNGTARSRKADQDAVANLTLKAGWNRLLIKVENQGGGWGFLARFAEGDELTLIIDLDISPQWASGIVPSGESKEFSAKIPLTRGINMISLPLNSDTPYTASTFATALNSTIVIQVKDGFFDAYVHAGSIGNNFPIRMSKGYIVNVMEAQTFNIIGKPWGEPVPAAPHTNTPAEPWAFVIAGHIEGLFRGLTPEQRGGQLRATNLRTKESIVVPISPSGQFVAAFVDMSKQGVVEAGDIITNQIIGANNASLTEAKRYIISHEQITQAYLLTHLSAMPEKSRLLQNYPNPFNPETWIPYQLAKPADVSIHIYDARGQLIRTLLLGQKNTGFYIAPSKAAYWNGRNASGERVASGIYFYLFTAGDFRATRRMVIVK